MKGQHMEIKSSKHTCWAAQRAKCAQLCRWPNCLTENGRAVPLLLLWLAPAACLLRAVATVGDGCRQLRAQTFSRILLGFVGRRAIMHVAVALLLAINIHNSINIYNSYPPGLCQFQRAELWLICILSISKKRSARSRRDEPRLLQNLGYLERCKWGSD